MLPSPGVSFILAMLVRGGAVPARRQPLRHSLEKLTATLGFLDPELLAEANEERSNPDRYVVLEFDVDEAMTT